MKRKIALSLGGLALVATMAIGGTLAYLNAMTETVTNVFTGCGDIGGYIEEEFDEEAASSYIPGEVITKIPQLVNNAEGKSMDAWVAIKVDITDDLDNVITYEEFSSKYATITTNGKEGFNTTDFEEVVIPGADYKFFVYKTALPVGTATPAIFDHVVVNAGIETVYNKETATTTVYKEVKAGTPDAKEIDGKYYVVEDVTYDTYESHAKNMVLKDGKLVDADIDKLPKFEVNVSGYMVQAENVDYDTAVAELTALVQK